MDSTSTIQTLDPWIRTQSEFVRDLDANEVRRHGEAFVAGWQLRLALSEPITVDFLLSRDSPFAPPKIALPDATKSGVWPHVDDDGFLCVLPNIADVDPYDPVAVADIVLTETKDLLQDLLSGVLDSDFYREFDAYWVIGSDKSRHEFYSILDPDTPSGPVSVWQSSKRRVIGTDQESVEQWLQNFFQRKLHPVGSGFLIRLANPMQPKDYPNNAADLLNLVRANEPECVEMISRHLDDSLAPLTVVLASEAANGTDYGVVEICRMARTAETISRRGKSNRCLVDGFRDGKAPLAVKLKTQMKSSATTRSPLQRADAQWARGGRGHDPRFDVLQKLNVGFVGVGSVGSFIVDSLVQAGLGSVAMFDGDVMRWENTGRHLLGGESVGKHKTEAMRDHLRKNYPTIHQCHSHPRDWERVLADPAGLEDFDLIVSTTGSWKAECRLNDLHVTSGKTIPVVYAWLEPFAAAGHTIAILEEHGCLQCGFSGVGTFSRQVFSWPNSDTTLVSQAGCGSEFQPYGITDSLHSIAMATDLCMEVLLAQVNSSTHRVWVGKDRKVDTFERQWTEDWKTVEDYDNRVESVSEFPWSQDPDCSRCR